MRIVRNIIKCNNCNGIIESKHRHDFVWCSCKSIAVDGGLDYQKIVGNREDFDNSYTEYSNEPKPVETREKTVRNKMSDEEIIEIIKKYM